MTKKSLLDDIKKLTRKINDESHRRIRNEYLETKLMPNFAMSLSAKMYRQCYSKNLEGRHYIHSKATKKQLLAVLEDLINFAYDHRVISSAYDI